MFRVYVGNLPYAARQAELKEFFVAGGIAEDNVSEAIVPLTEDGRSKGFGFVQFADEESYKKALTLDGQEMSGRPLRINEARPKEERQPAVATVNADTSPASDASAMADSDSADDTVSVDSDSTEEK